MRLQKKPYPADKQRERERGRGPCRVAKSPLDQPGSSLFLGKYPNIQWIESTHECIDWAVRIPNTENWPSEHVNVGINIRLQQRTRSLAETASSVRPRAPRLNGGF